MRSSGTSRKLGGPDASPARVSKFRSLPPAAASASGHLEKSNIAIPDEVAVVGFDDLPSAARSTPSLTTVHQPTVEKGKEAGRLLIAQLRGAVAPESVLLPTSLMVRESA